MCFLWAVFNGPRKPRASAILQFFQGVPIGLCCKRQESILIISFPPPYFNFFSHIFHSLTAEKKPRADVPESWE